MSLGPLGREEEEEVEEAAQNDNNDEEKPQGYVSFFLFVLLLRDYVLFSVTQLVFSTGSCFVSPLRFFVCSSFLLFSWQIPTISHLLALKKNPSTLSLSLSFTHSLLVHFMVVCNYLNYPCQTVYFMTLSK